MLRDEDLAVLGYWEWLEGPERGVAAHHAGHAAGVQGDRRGPLPAEAPEGRVRDRDARARRQHARPVGRAREAREVQRRGARAHHAGGVHPAHGPRRAPRHRRRGPLGHPVGRRTRPRGGRRARLAAELPAELELPPDLQHGREPHRPVRPRAHPPDPRALVRAVPGRPGRRRSGPHPAQAGGVDGGLRAGDDLPPRRLRRVRRDPPPHRRARAAVAKGNPTHAQRERMQRELAAERKRDARPSVPRLRRARAARPLGRALVAPEAGPRPTARARSAQPHRAGRQRFDRVAEVLEELGYLESEEDGSPVSTSAGAS